MLPRSNALLVLSSLVLVLIVYWFVSLDTDVEPWLRTGADQSPDQDDQPSIEVAGESLGEGVNDTPDSDIKIVDNFGKVTDDPASGTQSNPKPDKWPPLNSLIQDGEIIGDVSWLMDVAHIGHTKTASTLMMNWIADHPESQMHHSEQHYLTRRDATGMTKMLYNLPEGKEYIRGYKAPSDIVYTDTLDLLTEYWPKANLLVGLRHPIMRFESWYNMRYHAKTLARGVSIPPADELVANCTERVRLNSLLPRPKKQFSGLPDFLGCMDYSRFHVHLAWLGKTNPSSPEEDALLGDRDRSLDSRAKMPHKVFIYDSKQLSDSNKTRFEIFREDLQHFLGLEAPFEPLPSLESAAANVNTAEKGVEICEDRYQELRAFLMQTSVNASAWIRQFFMYHEDVTVSSPEYFEEILLSWEQDPCEERKHI